MANVWKPVRGVTIIWIGARRYLFQFYSESDLTHVLEEGPWTFDQNLIVLAKLKSEDLPLKVPLNKADLWIQVHVVLMGFFSVKNAIKTGNFVGNFIRVDEQKISAEWNPYMRIRVNIDLNRPLKRKLFLQSDEGENFCAKFRYEKLPSFCFACGIIGHAERFCPRYPDSKGSSGELLFGPELRASKGNVAVGGINGWSQLAKEKGRKRRGDRDGKFRCAGRDAKRERYCSYGRQNGPEEEAGGSWRTRGSAKQHGSGDGHTKNGEEAGYNARLTDN
ncbi:unnamed protein product [Cuscuta europaea]|uniref:CCHC-type domain-containing protein n=1 Tax=Cuscuta europaea TaxID=41803 RepID=A0A9P1E7X6_CUSEU|nr:unnamed protein product [Cuscuta europaea]